MKYDLVICYRICPKISKTPPVFADDKLKLSKLCLESFRESLSGLNFKIYALLDGCPEEYEDLFKKNFEQERLEIIHLDNLGNKKTFKKQIEILSNQKESEVIYFAEDDYFYIKNLKNMVDLINNNSVDFVTPYEHPACYTEDHVIRKKIITFEKQKYIASQHACLTFMTTKKNLLKNKRYFLIFSNWFGSDFVVWGCVTLGITYFKYIRLLFNLQKYNLENIKVFGSMLFFAVHRFIFNKKYKLFMPIQTIATHMENDNLSPGINWSQYINIKK